jgi:transposase-like protein
MKQEQQQQAERLYFQTDLNKTQIAEAIGISRSTLHYWVRENNWEYLKRSGAAMPSLIAGNCYLAMAQLSEHILSEERKNKPITREEVESLYKLTLTINKLKARVTLNESMETFTGFIESLHNRSPKLADGVKPYISRYISSCAAIRTGDMKPPKPNNHTTASPEQDQMEAMLDKEDIATWSRSDKPFMEEEQTAATAPLSGFTTPAAPMQRPPEKPAQPKYDIRKQLRGTATKGPGKSFYHKQDHAGVAA